jgi:hypothetical protein
VVGQSRDDVLTVVQAGGHHPGSQYKPPALSRYSAQPLLFKATKLGGGEDVTCSTKLLNGPEIAESQGKVAGWPMQKAAMPGAG